MVTYVDELTVLHCAECGISFGITEDFRNRRKNDHRNFNCPVGHTNIYTGETEAEKLRKQLNQEREFKERAYEREKQALSRLSSIKGVLTKTKRRIANGVCPCCNRTFGNLAQHMNTKHPTYKSEKVSK